MNPLRKTLLSLAVLGVAGAVAGTGAFSAFSKTTSNDGNEVTAGDVTLADNDAGVAAYDMPTAKPGDTNERCIRVTFNGNLPSTVKLYRTAFTGSTGLESNVNLTILKSATGTQANCSDFGSSSSVFATAALSTFSGTSFSNGITLTDQTGSAVWNNGDAVTYRITATLPSSGVPDTAQGKTTGTHSFVWEAQNN
ncbi:MAG: hypothetical protein QOG63_1752 [Thermoleophilaceae bacterium]|nr:hypothetical protein [Thermoleophilaceae bacterium]